MKQKKIKELTDLDEPDDFVKEYMEEIKENYGKSFVSTDFKYYVDDNVKMFAKELKEYGGTTLQYVAIMPTDEELDEYIKDVSAETLSGLIGKLKETTKDDSKDGVITKINGTVPMFKFDYGLSHLKEDFKKMGIEDVFNNEKANLSNLVDSEGVFINNVAHKADIDFSNQGIKAAAATVFTGGLGDGGDRFDYEWDVPVEEIDLSFNKPFMFLIRNIKTGEIWFSGTVYEPTKLES